MAPAFPSAGAFPYQYFQKPFRLAHKYRLWLAFDLKRRRGQYVQKSWTGFLLVAKTGPRSSRNSIAIFLTGVSLVSDMQITTRHPSCKMPGRGSVC